MFSIGRDSDMPEGAEQKDPDAPKGERRRSVLHEGITINGDWTSDGIVEFGGTIIGDLTVDTLIVARSGRIEGNVRARNVTLEGHLEGTVAAINVVIRPSAEVKAEIACQSITIDAGARIEGKVMCKAQAPTSQPRESAST